MPFLRPRRKYFKGVMSVMSEFLKKNSNFAHLETLQFLGWDFIHDLDTKEGGCLQTRTLKTNL